MKIDVRSLWADQLRMAAAARAPLGSTIRAAAEEDETELILMGVFGWDMWAEDLVPRIRAITSKSIRVTVNSPGGSVFDAIAIYDALRLHPANVTTHVTGLAASAASFVIQAGNQRRASAASMLMIHDALGLTIGNEADHLESAALLSKASDTIAGVYAARSTKDSKYWRAEMRAERWYSAAEALDAELLDEVEDERNGGPENAAPAPVMSADLAAAIRARVTRREGAR